MPVAGQGVQDSIPEVYIHARPEKQNADLRNRYNAGQKTIEIDQKYISAYQLQNIAQLLSQQTSVFVKSYGINGLATLSFRGASAAQSAVLWNGIPLMNPALGIADLSLLHTGLFDDVRLQYGSSAALYGNANVGGALVIGSSRPGFQARQEVALTLGAGSFGRKDIAGKWNWANKRWNINIRGFYQRADNDFRYEDHSGQQQQLDNARLSAGGVLVAADYNLSKVNSAVSAGVLSLQLWWQEYRRQIPPALFEPYSVKHQQDASFRSLLQWRKQGRKFSYYIKSSYSDESLHYKDSVARQNNRNTVAQYYGEAGMEWRIHNPDQEENGESPFFHHLLLYVPFQYTTASGENMRRREEQVRPSVVAAYRLADAAGRLQLNIALRQELVNGERVPFLPGGGFLWKVWRKDNMASVYSFSFSGNIQRTYRIPTLNELYYFPGGNDQLKPEKGWAQEAGYIATAVFKKKPGAGGPGREVFRISHGITMYHRKIDDWIYWMGGVIWTPHNIARVSSRGLETENEITCRVKETVWHLSFKWAYTLSTSLASYIPGDGSIGKQVPYAPRYNGQANLGLTWKGFFLNYNHTYTGYRFITIDESQYLLPYQTGNAQIMYGLNAGACKIQFAVQVQNIFNARYEIVSGRPMPGRYFLANIQLGWKK